MCGITGILNITGQNGVSLKTLKSMTSVLHHRGPDEAGIYLDNHIGLGHTRLSIIDLCSGSQPIHNEDETMWIIYNGEVYNYLELKEQLLAKGHRFLTTSDTEVILHLYEEKGPACLDDLNGQFAFAIWDSRKKELFLARDRVGIRPLHYTLQNGRLIFSSEIKSIFMAEDVPREIDPIAMDQIFTFWTTLPGRTAFRGIHELPPGHYMKVSAGEIKVKKYWDIPLFPPQEQMNCPSEEINEEIHRQLLDAVRIRLRADVPVGSYLSGGLDSSGITALIVKNFNSDVRTFGIRFEEDAFDEGKHQGQMVEFLKANHSEIMAGNEMIGASFPDVLWSCEKPILRTAPVPLFLLSELVNGNGLKVVLTGEGADEFFGGYNIFREAKIREFWSREPDSKIRPELIRRLYPYIFSNPRLKPALKSFFAKGLDKPDDPLFSHMIRWENTSKIKTFFSDELRAEIGQQDNYEEIRQMLPPSYDKLDYLSKAQYLETAIFLSNYLLSSQGDRMAMAHSVEIRLPYLDPNLMEFMGRVPSKWKILGLNEKYSLKQVYRNILPEEIIARSKHPYRAPINQSLLNGKTAEYTLELLSENAIEKTGLFDAAKVEKLLKKSLKTVNTSEVDNMALVGVLSGQILSRQFIDNFSVRTSEFVNATPSPRVYDRRGGHSEGR